MQEGKEKSLLFKQARVDRQPFFVRDPKRCFASFDPRYARISTCRSALRLCCAQDDTDEKARGEAEWDLSDFDSALLRCHPERSRNAVGVAAKSNFWGNATKALGVAEWDLSEEDEVWDLGGYCSPRKKAE